METIDWDELAVIFERVKALPSDERAAHLDAVCAGKPALRRELDALLGATADAADFFESLRQKVFAPEPSAPIERADPYDLSGSTIRHYRVLDKLGGGGMGVVYKAYDTHLRRDMALKFLPPHLTHDPEARQRFVTEAQAASALDHPNVCTIYEIGETDQGQTFIAMACYDGETLKKKIERGPLPMKKALDYATQIAQALSKAHSRNIIHRDIKPANVMVTEDGIVKVLDFGLAKIADLQLTQTGMTMGTAAYMSPEQARGEGIDHRTDIWSLGVVLYEMLTGVRPFGGDYAQAIIYNVLHEEPRPLGEFNAALPPDLLHVVATCLEKDKAQRYAAMADLQTDLSVLAQGARSQAWLNRTLTAPGQTEPGASFRRAQRPAEGLAIVVLPFEDISPGKDNEYFSDGLTEEIITDLSQVQALSVISRTSAMMLKGTDKSVKTIGRELKVRYVLEGSVRKAGNNLRITAQLIDARADVHLWAEKYKGTLDDIFDIQETVSRSIVEALRLQLSTTEHHRIAERPIDDVRAYESYLRARQEIWRWSEDALDRALEHLQNSLNIIGENALLYAGIGYVHWQYVNIGSKPIDHLFTAEAYARKVFALEPDSLHGHRLYGLILVTRRDMQGAIRYLKQALEIDPNDSDTLYWLCSIYGYIGKTSAALPLADKLLTIDPLNPLNHAVPGWLQTVEGHFELALDLFHKAYEMDRANPVYRFGLARALAYSHRFDEAYTLLDQLAEEAPGTAIAQLCLFLKYALQGEKTKVLESATPELMEIATGEMTFAWMIAGGYAMIDEKEDALEWLATAVRLGFVHHPFLSRLDPFLENIRGEERFHQLMEEVKESSERLEA